MLLIIEEDGGLCSLLFLVFAFELAFLLLFSFFPLYFLFDYV
jgi:hypothetical protein